MRSFLDLHGAGVAECADDAEGELLARVRAVVGPEMIIIATLDLHANVTERMLALTNAMTAYRTYPHVDMRETGVRAGRHACAADERWPAAGRCMPSACRSSCRSTPSAR